MSRAGRLWATGAATAVVAALASVGTTLLMRGVLDVAVFAPRRAGVCVWGGMPPPATSRTLRHRLQAASDRRLDDAAVGRGRDSRAPPGITRR